MLDLLGARSLTLSELSPTDDDWYLKPALDRPTAVHPAHPRRHIVLDLPSTRSERGSPPDRELSRRGRRERAPRRKSAHRHVLQAPAPTVFSSPKTASRSTLGFMNEMAFKLRYFIADAGGLERC